MSLVDGWIVGAKAGVVDAGLQNKSSKAHQSTTAHPPYHSSIKEQTAVVCFTARIHHPRLCSTLNVHQYMDKIYLFIDFILEGKRGGTSAAAGVMVDI
ncbi:MAG: hypothetical protein J7578_02185 [Chitinophagaceae bacterium]|nr:hypothetical protein [Chitinophagaceae bacterium]